MKNIKSFTIFNESYDENFNEFIVKNIFSDDVNVKNLWSMISEILQYMKHREPEMVDNFKHDLLTRSNTLKVATNYAIKLNTDGKLQDICDQLIKLRMEEKNNKHIIEMKVKNSTQAEDLKDVLTNKPWYNRVKINGHNLFVDIKTHTIDEIKTLIQTLPFKVEIINN